MKELLISEYSHFYLYAKYWYKRNNNLFEDLKKILSDYTGVQAEYLSDDDVLNKLTDIVAIDMTTDRFNKFIFDILRRYKWQEQKSLHNVLLMEFLNILNMTVTKDKIRLAEPDAEILELAK